jgi:antitoxin HicB
MRFAWPAQIRRDDEDGRYLVTFRDFPEAGTDGADEAEALAEAEDCLTSVILLRAKYGEPIPTPSRPRRGERPITPDPALALKAALHVALRRRGMTAADLARALGVDHREARRVLDPRHATKLPRMAEALAATGLRVVLDVDEAA